MEEQAFECGVPGTGNAGHRFSVRFYLVAILFLLFDVEAIFFFPWAVVFKKFLSINSFILVEMGSSSPSCWSATTTSCAKVH